MCDLRTSSVMPAGNVKTSSSASSPSSVSEKHSGTRQGRSCTHEATLTNVTSTVSASSAAMPDISLCRSASLSWQCLRCWVCRVLCYLAISEKMGLTWWVTCSSSDDSSSETSSITCISSGSPIVPAASATPAVSWEITLMTPEVTGLLLHEDNVRVSKATDATNLE